MRVLTAMKSGALLAIALVATFPGNAEAQKRSRDVIKREEIMKEVSKEVDLLAAIQRLRPHFLEGRGPRSFGGSMRNPLRFYFNRNEHTFEDLRVTMAWDVEEVRYLAPSEAEGRFGGHANGGAIVIKIDKKLAKKDST
jgi:hypothetical protein